MQPARLLTLAAFVALALLCLAWELWLAPLRPGGSMLALKALPLLLALPGIARGRVRSYQAWSMGILAYFCEGLVRATSDRGTSAMLAWVEVALTLAAFAGILLYVRAARRATAITPAGPR